MRARTCLFASSKEQLRRLEFYYKHSRSSFKDREGRMKILEELSKHGETEGQAKLHTWSMNRGTKEKRQAAQADMARITGEALHGEFYDMLPGRPPVKMKSKVCAQGRASLRALKHSFGDLSFTTNTLVHRLRIAKAA